MKLGTKGRYAVTAMVDIASHGQDKPVTLASIAARQEISLSYLEQLIAKLSRKGLVKSARGPGGGLSLAKPATEIYISDIVCAAEESLKTTRCSGNPDEGCRLDKSRCLTHDLWERLEDTICTFLGSVSLADVAYGKLRGQHSCASSRKTDFMAKEVVAHG